MVELGELWHGFVQAFEEGNAFCGQWDELDELEGLWSSQGVCVDEVVEE